jgi:Tfp pilus assembly protein PilF
LYFSNKAPSTAPVMLRLGSRTFDIPPGESDYVVSDSYILPVDAEALRIYPHAHYLGKDIWVTARMPDGRTERLLHIPHWDFNWQDDYEYANPVSLPRGSAIVMRYVFDNSENNPHNPVVPPVRVRFGPQATDEMAELLVQVVPKRPSRKMLLTDIAGEEKRIADVPGDVDTRNSLGVHYMQISRADEALAQFKAAIRLDPGHAVANYNLAVLAMGRQQYDEAREYFERALSTRPDYPEAHTNYGVLLQRTGKPADAVSHFRAALVVKPGNAAARNNLGRTLLQQGRPDEAIQQFQEWVRIQPENATAIDLLASAYAAAGDFEHAVRTGEQALTRALASKDELLARAIRQRILIYQQQSEAAAPR